MIFDKMRDQWRELMIGRPDYVLTDPIVVEKTKQITQEAEAIWQLMAKDIELIFPFEISGL